MIVDVLVRMLRMDGYNPLSASGGKQCLRLLEKDRPDLILLDIMMEPMDGWETLRQIKENPATRDIPVAMLTAKQLTPDEVSKYGSLIEDYIMKPTTHRQLNEAITYILSRRDGILNDILKAEQSGVDREIVEEYAELAHNVDVLKGLLNTLTGFYDIHNAQKRGPIGQNIARAVQQLAMVARFQEERLHQIRSQIHSA